MDILLLLLYGVIGGILAGLLGVGGGVIYILILPLFLSNAGVCEEELVSFVISNSIFAIMFVSIAANIKSVLQKTFEYKKVVLIGFFGSLSSILAMEYIVRSSWYSKLQFNIAVVVLMTFMMVRLFVEIKTKKSSQNLILYPIIGLIAGLVSALSGVGGGVIIVPLLVYFYGNDMRESKVISLGAIGIMAFALSFKNALSIPSCQIIPYSIGYIVLPISLFLSVGVLVGTPLGIKVAHIISDKWLKILFSLMLLVVIGKKFIEIAQELEWLSF